MRRTINWLGMAGFALVITLAASVEVHPQGTSQADEDLKKLADDFTRAWTKGDANALAGFHTQDAIRIPGDGQVVTGRAAIERNFSQGLSGPWKGSTLTITPGTSRQLTPDVSVGEGRFQITGGTPPPGAATTGQYLNTYVRQGGRWQIATSAIILPPATTR